MLAATALLIVVSVGDVTASGNGRSIEVSAGATAADAEGGAITLTSGAGSATPSSPATAISDFERGASWAGISRKDGR